MLAWKKGLGSSNEKGIVSPSYCVYQLRSIEQDHRYFHYLYRTDLYAETFRRFSRGIIESRLRLYSEEFFNTLSLLPPPEEQTAIANFLDEKTAKIDSLIEKKQKLIDLLKEERTAIINQTVTKGINQNVKLKPSGIDWLGDIPEHWEVKKLKYVAELKSGESITSDNIRESDEFSVYGGNGLRGYTSSYTHIGEYILIGRQGALCGNINYASGKFFASEHAVVVTRINDEDILWLGELLRSMNLNQYSISAAQPGLSVERIQNLSIPYPPIDEQKEIGNYIDTETKRIDSSITKIEKEIELLQEYRTALISEVVTGKIDVRN
ncbi:MAG: restriction endonuclease subunit S [bacterium]|nr:restriction endonuclease subunit S [bacterium]